MGAREGRGHSEQQIGTNGDGGDTGGVGTGDESEKEECEGGGGRDGNGNGNRDQERDRDGRKKPGGSEGCRDRHFRQGSRNGGIREREGRRGSRVW